MNTNDHQQTHGLFTSVAIRALAQGSAMPPWKRRLVYFIVALSALAVLWIPATVVTTMSEQTYTSKWTLILPGSGSGHAVNLDSIGQASATMSSPYSGTSLDPKVNYRAIAESVPVLSRAAESVNLSLAEFGKPRIKLVDQSSLIYFSITAASPELARNKSYALYNALQQQLEWLREDESSSREQAARTLLASFGKKLSDAQNDMLSFQTNSSILSIEQFNELTLTIERLRTRRTDLQAELKGLEQRTRSLGEILGLEPVLAADAMALQQDQLFQRFLKNYAEAAALYTEYDARWGENHPKLIKVLEQRRKARQALLKRSRQLLRKSMPVERLLTLGVNDNRAGLFQELVTLHTRAEGMRSQNATLATQIDELQQRLESITTEAASLEDLKRKQQVATAVFTTALAKLDMGKSDMFSSYPLIQMLAHPSLPRQPDNLKKVLALGGAAGGTLLCLIALGLLWIRKPYFRKILMKK